MSRVNGEPGVDPTPAVAPEAGVATPNNGDTAGIVNTSKTPATEPNQTKKWTGMLPDKYKNDPRFADKDSFLDALDSILGEKEPAQTEDGKSVENKDPLPEVTEYKFSKTFDKTLDSKGVYEKSILETIKGSKLDQKTADLLHSAMVDSMQITMDAFKKSGAEDCNTILRDQWGDKYDVQSSNAKKAYSRLVKEGSDLDKNLKATQVENNPFVQQLLAKIGEGISETTIPNSNGSVLGRRDTGSSFLSKDKDEFRPF